MNTRLQQTTLMPALSFTSVQGGLLQRKCACGNQTLAGGECEACSKKRLELQRRAVDNKSEQSEVPPIVHEVLRTPGQPLDAATRAFFEPRFGHDFSQVRVHTDAKAAKSARAVNAVAYTVGPDIVFQTQVKQQTGLTANVESFVRSAPNISADFELGQKLGQTIEEVGRSQCDLDAGKMTWSVDIKKIPLCMADCAKDHELSHVGFREAECKKVSSAYKAAMDAIDKVEKSKSEADLKKAEQAIKDSEKAAEAYEKWFKETCRESEALAYQAGIDKCKTKEIEKQCTDLKETKRFTEIMKQWETFKKNPPNCPEPPKKPEEQKVDEPKEGKPKKSPEPKKPPAK